MPSSLITADDTDQVYQVEQLTIHLSVGSSGVIFRGAGTSASTLPDSLGVRYSPYSSPSLPFH